MALYYGDNKIKKIFFGDQKIKSIYFGETKVWSGASVVTYHVDTNITYDEEIDEGLSVLSPKSFTPTRSGWTFLGWRSDSTASQYVHSSMVANGDHMDLYAVFVKDVTVTYYLTTTVQTTTKQQYYNNGNIVNPTFNLTVSAVSGWTIRGWSTSSAGNATISYTSGQTYTISANTTIYASWQKTVTLSYNGNGSTSGSVSSHSGTAYRNYAGSITNATFTLKANGFTKTSYTFYRWRLSSTSGSQYKAGATISLNASATMYAQWIQTVTNFSYAGKIDSFTALAGVTYTLACYGAQGGSMTSWAKGGYGGYAAGNKAFTANTTLYIVVGGQGGHSNSDVLVNGGYNGGGTGKAAEGSNNHAGSGGGATHIATESGLLSAIKGANVLVAAGGGGGGYYSGNSSDKERTGKPGGGTTGLTSTQGQGANGTNAQPGGGGGWRGGSTEYYNGAYGGSSYTGGVTNATATAGQRTGNGYATITVKAVS